MTVWIGPEGGIDDFDVVFGNMLWVVFVLGIETLLESVVHGVDGGLPGFVAAKCIDVLLLDEK